MTVETVIKRDFLLYLFARYKVSDIEFFQNNQQFYQNSSNLYISKKISENYGWVRNVREICRFSKKNSFVRRGVKLVARGPHTSHPNFCAARKGHLKS